MHPDTLLGPLYQPFVTLAVSIILFEAGLRLSFGEVARGIRSIVVRLIAVGVLVTWLGVAVTVALLFNDMSRGVALLIGAVLVVSGPTVVLPMLAFIRPTRDVRSLLKWEGVLVDPIGALLGVFVFHAVQSGGAGEDRIPDEALASIGVGALRRSRGRCVPVAVAARSHTGRPDDGRPHHADGGRRRSGSRRPHP